RPARETKDQFESWVKGKMTQRLQTFSADRIASGNYVVPIVVHVIHNGEAIGTGSNISDAQILSQLTVLNNDFQRLNADTIKTLDEFKPVAGKFQITFVMAKQDPNGQATTGINRVKGTQTSWDISDNYRVKALSYWPAEDYLNIWIVNLSGGLLGYTQLPVSSTLKGLEDASNDRLTDGVVIDYQAFGTSQAGSFNLLNEYNLGRTATHELGHFFGLRHVWGDVNSCNPVMSTDYVDDTPIQDTNYNGTCPSGTQIDCSGHAMYANYMNYTDDACMNIYSKGQVSRMDVIINNSPRRASLLTSLGSQAPVPVANDLQLKSINAPNATACSGNLIPLLLIRNFGSNIINSSQIRFSLNGSSIETKDFTSLNLSPENETIVSFSPVSLTAGTTNKFSFQVLQTNGVADGKASNDTLSISTYVPLPAALPLVEPFNSTPASWSIINNDGLNTWKNIPLPGSNHAMYIDFYTYENSGALDLLITPVFDLTTATTASISFDYAYATMTGGSNDRLRVMVSSSCDFNSSPVEIFNKSGSALATATSGSSFTPSSSQWASKIISLDQFVGQRIQIAFEGINAYGNNLYLDNVTVLNDPITAFALNQVVSPSPVSCLSSTAPVIKVKNLGNTVINSFTVDAYINNLKTTQQISGAQIDVGASKEISLAKTTFSNGSNTYSVVIKSPNGTTSGASIKDSLATGRYINSASDIIPSRQNFDGNFDAWTTMSPDFKSIWHPVSTNKTLSMVFDAFSNVSAGEQAWLVSPVLDFSKANKASVFFETSYAYRSPNSETLQVFYSTDCGENFTQQLFSSSGKDLKNTDSGVSWTPSSDTQWTRQYINLDTLTGKENVRLAFVATNGNGNNLYIDNIEFFTNDNQFPQEIKGIYSVYGGTGTPLQVTFNLPERQLVRLQVYDIMGHVVSDQMLPDTLNQTYTIDSSGHSVGIYIVRVQTQTPASLSSTKVLFGF
ncbi:MAG: choice-of-anchor J domain-containing protein, partial [Bacteroidetes bacterium]|nr:choice-of-anchor J domain-containing protein [Bacteroidota bacterium]